MNPFPQTGQPHCGVLRGRTHDELLPPSRWGRTRCPAARPPQWPLPRRTEIGDTDDDIPEAASDSGNSAWPILGASDHTHRHSPTFDTPTGNDVELFIDVAGRTGSRSPPHRRPGKAAWSTDRHLRAGAESLPDRFGRRCGARVSSPILSGAEWPYTLTRGGRRGQRPARVRRRPESDSDQAGCRPRGGLPVAATTPALAMSR